MEYSLEKLTDIAYFIILLILLLRVIFKPNGQIPEILERRIERVGRDLVKSFTLEIEGIANRGLASPIYSVAPQKLDSSDDPVL